MDRSPEIISAGVCPNGLRVSADREFIGCSIACILQPYVLQHLSVVRDYPVSRFGHDQCRAFLVHNSAGCVQFFICFFYFFRSPPCKENSMRVLEIPPWHWTGCKLVCDQFQTPVVECPVAGQNSIIFYLIKAFC
jgi:hypothetical protein